MKVNGRPLVPLSVLIGVAMVLIGWGYTQHGRITALEGANMAVQRQLESLGVKMDRLETKIDRLTEK